MRGEPRNLVCTLEPIDANYEVAIALLKEHYGQVDLLIEQNVADLLNLQPVSNPNDTARLRQLLITIQAARATLEAQGCTLRDYALSFAPVLRRSLPPRLAFDFSERQLLTSANDQPSTSSSSPSATGGEPRRAEKFVEDIVTYLRRYLEVHEQASALKGKDDLKHKGKDDHKREGEQRQGTQPSGPSKGAEILSLLLR